MRRNTLVAATAAVLLGLGTSVPAQDIGELFGKKQPIRLVSQPARQADPMPLDTAAPRPAPSIQPSAEQPADGEIKPLDRVSLDILPPVGKFPERPSDAFYERSIEEPGVAQRAWNVTPMAWQASGLSHRPLYFEEVALERYGHTWGAAQTAVSAAHFFMTVPMLPYKMTLEQPFERVYALGYYRPGSVAPRLRYRFPWRLDAILVEAGAVGAVAAILP